MDNKINSRDRRARAVRFGLLKDWYGEEYARTEIAAHTHAAEPIANASDRLMDSLEQKEISDYIKLTQNWPSFCGEALAKYLTPDGIQDGVLTLCVPHSGLISMISPSLELIQNKINASFGPSFCRQIRLTTNSAFFSRKKSLAKKSG
ncbi:MAG: DUF721 domain-containing protein [Lentisphaeria bacterium]|nr:DUF721 domain-containing protein [Lentisphaeria bacterium]